MDSDYAHCGPFFLAINLAITDQIHWQTIRLRDHSNTSIHGHLNTSMIY